MIIGLIIVGVIFDLDLSLGLCTIVSGGRFNKGFSGSSCFPVQPEIFFISDGDVSMFMEVGDGILSTGNCGSKKKVGGSEYEIVLMFAGECEAVWGGCAVGSQFQVVNEAIEWFLVLAVKITWGGWKAHCMPKFLVCEGLAMIAKSTEGPAAVFGAWEAVQLVTGGEGKHDREWIGHEMLHDCITERGVRMLIDCFSREEVVGMLEFLVSIVNMSCNKEFVAIDFRGVGGVKGLEVVRKEFWDYPVCSWLIGGEEGADKLRIIL